VASDFRVLLQQIRDLAEDGVFYAIGMQALEQQKRLESGVGRAASIHPPVPLRAMGRGKRRDGSQRESWGRLRRASGHRTARGRWARWSGGIWAMSSVAAVMERNRACFCRTAPSPAAADARLGPDWPACAEGTADASRCRSTRARGDDVDSASDVDQSDRIWNLFVGVVFYFVDSGLGDGFAACSAGGSAALW